MTKRHFIALADALRKAKPEHTGEYDDGTTVGMMRDREEQWESDIKHIADFCQSQNYNFNRQRWLDYIEGKCGPNGGTIK